MIQNLVNKSIAELTRKYGADCFVDGNPERALIPWKDTEVTDRDFVYRATFPKGTTVQQGSFIQAGERSFLVSFVEAVVSDDKRCKLLKVNAEVEVLRYHQEYDSNMNKVGGPIFQTRQADVKGFCQYVTGRLRQEEPGLLSTTTYILILQTSVQVRKPHGLPSPDRVLLNGKPYRVDVVDDLKYPNLLYVQLSEDTR